MKKIYALILILLMGCGDESGTDPVEEKLNYTITVSAGEGGSVDTLGGTYPEGTVLTITATPDAEYLFDGWSGTEISTSNPLNVILTGNESVVANFVKKQYDLALSIEGEGTVEEVVTKTGKEYASGSEVELTAIPAEGWMFNGWTGDLETIDNPVSITIDEAKSVTANFIRKTYELTVNIEGEGTVDEQVVVAPSQYEFETQVELTANPAEGWEFSNWSGAVEGTDNPVTIEITDAKEVTAVFIRKIYDLNISIEGEGTVAEEVVVAPSQYEFETQVKLTATPAELHKFVGWSGFTETTDNPITILIDQGISLTATFELNDTDGDGVTDDVDQCPNTPEGAVIDENGCQIPPIYLDENGVTIKARDFAQIGDTWEINGAEYTVVDETTLRQMVNNDEDVTKVVTTFVTDMSRLIYNKTLFNQDIGSWDTSNVISMSETFAYAEIFNQDIGYWDTSSVVTTSLMFLRAYAFNQDIESWDTSNINDMSAMFHIARLFNKPIGSWDVSNVSNMSSMFDTAENFNQDISQWNVQNVQSMKRMFLSSPLNQDISSWNVSSVTNMTEMFAFNNNMNQDLSSWNVSQVTACSSFNAYSNAAWTLPKPNFTNCNPN